MTHEPERPDERAGGGGSVNPIAFTDPDELLEVYDALGRPTGRAKARGPIHRDGDWHLAFYCWIVRAGPERQTDAGSGDHRAYIVLQKRSDLKDTWPGRFDASAAGHVRFGESRAEMLREVEEELGLYVAEAELVRLPRHSQEHRHPNGIVDREHHDLNLLRCDLPFERYRPSPSEVSGLTVLPADALADLAEGLIDGVDAELVEVQADGTSRRSPIRLHQQDLVPYETGYHRHLAAAAAELIEGERRA